MKENKTTVTVSDVINDAKDRINTETPPFFERIRRWAKVVTKISAGVAVVGAGVITTCASAGVALPLWVTIGVGVLSGVGTLGAGIGVGAAKIANMTTTDSEILARPSNIK